MPVQFGDWISALGVPLAAAGLILLSARIFYVRKLLPCWRAAMAFRTVPPKVREVLRRHQAALIRKRAQLLQADEYGHVDRKRWDKELDHFLRKIIFPQLTPEELAYAEANAEWIKRSLLCEPLKVRSEAQQGDRVFDRGMGPLAYEQYCGSLLRDAGWEAHVSKGSGDYGADVVARKGSFRVAIQCKLYSKPVRAKAVQEALAGQHYYDCQAACVVANQDYTPAARMLAKQADVQLSHHESLASDLEALLRASSGGGETTDLARTPPRTRVKQPLGHG